MHFLFQKIRAFPEDFFTIWSFLFQSTITPTSFRERLGLILKCYRISYSVESPHMENEIIQVISAILSLKPSSEGVLVEAGSYKGGSTAKLSLAARIAKRKLVVFDSFEGIPEHREVQGKNIFGGNAYFPPGSYAGSLEEVSNNVKRFGAIEVCQFRKGWFKDTLSGFHVPVGVVYIDVDLESSTRTCIKYLYPLLITGGTLFSQDGHLPWVIKILNDNDFWKKEVGCQKPPRMAGLGKRKLVIIRKD